MSKYKKGRQTGSMGKEPDRGAPFFAHTNFPFSTNCYSNSILAVSVYRVFYQFMRVDIGKFFLVRSFDRWRRAAAMLRRYAAFEAVGSCVFVS
jgi:hypothetical protein